MVFGERHAERILREYLSFFLRWAAGTPATWRRTMKASLPTRE